MKGELQNTGLACIWHSQQEWDTSRLKRIIRDRCNDTERQNLFLIMSEKNFISILPRDKAEMGKGRVYRILLQK
jgi:hypothetical protein